MECASCASDPIGHEGDGVRSLAVYAPRDDVAADVTRVDERRLPRRKKVGEGGVRTQVTLPTGELCFDQLLHLRSDHRMVEAVDDFVQETGDEQLPRDWSRDAPRE